MFLSSLLFALVENLTGQSTLEREREREKRESQTVGLFVLHNLLIFFQTITFAPGSLEQFSHVSFCPLLEKSC